MTTEYHKLDKNEIMGQTLYAQSCNETRPCYWVRAASNLCELTTYFGMGHEVDHLNARGCVFNVVQYALVGTMLQVLGFNKQNDEHTMEFYCHMYKDEESVLPVWKAKCFTMRSAER